MVALVGCGAGWLAARCFSRRLAAPALPIHLVQGPWVLHSRVRSGLCACFSSGRWPAEPAPADRISPQTQVVRCGGGEKLFGEVWICSLAASDPGVDQHSVRLQGSPGDDREAPGLGALLGGAFCPRGISVPARASLEPQSWGLLAFVSETAGTGRAHSGPGWGLSFGSCAWAPIWTFCGHGEHSPRGRPDGEGPTGGRTERWALEEAWLLWAWPFPFLAPQASCS